MPYQQRPPVSLIRGRENSVLHDSSIRKLWLDTDWALRETTIDLEDIGGLRNAGAVFSEAS